MSASTPLDDSAAAALSAAAPGMAPPVAASTPRASATLVVARDLPAGGIEVLLLERGRVGDYNSGAWVFPGGTVDAGDRDLHAVCSGLDDVGASARLEVPRGGLDFYVTAIRECFEEAGLLLTREACAAQDPRAGQADPRFATWRTRLRSGELDFATLCREAGLRLAADALAYFSHWRTPEGLPKRYDTRFFLAAAPPGQPVEADGAELLRYAWRRPAEVLAPTSPLRLLTATRGVLAMLEPFDGVAAALAWARALPRIPLTAPQLPRSPAP